MGYRENYEYWLKNGDTACRAELKVIASDENEIRERFTAPLAFGTAGMRGIIAQGTARMNAYTVARATKGVAEYILSVGAAERGVVVSYDTRHMSFEFALESARVLGAAGVRAYLFENVRPVPVCSFAVRELGCAAGIMITASHNAKEYNGYKLYGEDGAQMSPEATAGVVGFMADVDYFGIAEEDVASRNHGDVVGKDNYALSPNITVVGKSVDERYYAAVSRLSLSPDAVRKVGKDIKLVYSPLHGSGWVPVTHMLAAMGINVDVVEEQKLPDGDFPTVAAPNPEQPDALAKGIALADKIGADLVIGTDPDCDRMGVAVRNEEGEFALPDGNRIGALLMDYVLMRRAEEGTLPANAAVVKTIVTTGLADKIAESYGVKCFDVLTGFKYIGEKIKEWETSGEYTFMFGYEESYGSLCGTHARDKDAVVASMLFAEMACYYEAKGGSVYGRLRQLFAEFGCFVEKSKSFVFAGLDGMRKMTDIMTAFRESDKTEFAGVTALSKTDFLKGEKVYADGRKVPSGLPSADVVKYEFPRGEWLCVRPSGTEPKLKIYVSVNAADEASAIARNKAFLDAAAELM